MAENEEMFDESQINEGSTVDVTDKKCPNCGATVTYDPETLSMTCEFCGYSRSLPKPEAASNANQEIDFNSAKIRQAKDWGAQKKNIVCQACGGSTMYDMNESAAVCPFCGSTSVMPVDDEEDVMAPGGVVPFEVSREKAANLFKSWLKGKFFAPNAAKKSCKADEFNGIYLPFWTFDSQTTSTYKAEYGKDYYVKDKDGNRVKKTRWYPCRGIYEEFIDDQVVYASSKTNNPHIKSVANFDFSKLRDYDPQFVAGFAAEKYSIGLDDGWKEAQKIINSRLNSNISSQIRSKYNADQVRGLNFNTTHDNVTFKYLLAPIWISNFKFKNKVYNFVVNGQTGKIAGNSPVSPLKVFLTILAIIVVIIILAAIFGGN